MGLIATPNAIAANSRAAEGARQPSGYRFLGVAIAAIVPAVIWSIIIEIVACGLGMPLSPTAITIVGISIAAFLFTVCAPLMLRKPVATAEVHAFARVTRR